MADIERLLFGSDPDEPDGLFAPTGRHADQLARSRDWCQSPPDDDAIEWLAASLGLRHRIRKPAADPWCENW